MISRALDLSCGDALGDGMEILTLLDAAGPDSERSEGRRLVQQGGIEVDGNEPGIKALITPRLISRMMPSSLKERKVYHRSN